MFSHRDLPPVPGAAIQFVRGDVRPVHAAMVAAAGGKNVWLTGGGDLVGQFHDAGLLDEIIVQVGSVTLGSGRPLLPRRIVSPPLELTAAFGHAVHGVHSCVQCAHLTKFGPPPQGSETLAGRRAGRGGRSSPHNENREACAW